MVCPVSALKLINSTDSMLFVLLLLVCQHCASFSRIFRTARHKSLAVWGSGGYKVDVESLQGLSPGSDYADRGFHQVLALPITMITS